jgi:hypothetical protein
LFCQNTIAPCLKDLATEKLEPLRAKVAFFDLKNEWTAGTEEKVVPSTCNDCYTYRATFARREKGKVKTYTIAWDDSTSRKAPAAIVEIAEKALKGSW